MNMPWWQHYKQCRLYYHYIHCFVLPTAPWTHYSWSCIKCPIRHNLGHLGGGLHSQPLDWYWQTKQYRKIHKLNTVQPQIANNAKIQQNKTILVQSPLTMLSQETRMACSTTLLSPHGAIRLCSKNKTLQTFSLIFIMSWCIVHIAARFFRLLLPHLCHCQQLQVRLSRLVVGENVIVIFFPASISLQHVNTSLCDKQFQGNITVY